jgi:hypothetical protein
MKARILLPLFAALVFTGTARSETPGQPRPDAPPPDAPSPERLRHRLEELRREGKNEEAERLERHAREFFEKHRANPPGERREESRRGNPPVSPGEREGHLAEAARHLHAAGINVSPEMLERLANRARGKFAAHPPVAPGSRSEHADRAPVRPPFPPRGEVAPGAGSPIDALHNEVRALAKQVQELRNIVQREHGGARPEQRADRPHPPLPPGAERERRGPDLRPPGEDRPRSDAPFPPPPR